MMKKITGKQFREQEHKILFPPKIENRKKCKGCNKPLISFNGHYLHPESPCNDVIDAKRVTMEITDNDIQDLFDHIYGQPEEGMSDYDMLNKYIEDIELMQKIKSHKILYEIIRILIK